MWGLSIALDPRQWRLEKLDAHDDELGRVVGVWWCFGPLAIYYGYE